MGPLFLFILRELIFHHSTKLRLTLPSPEFEIHGGETKYDFSHMLHFSENDFKVAAFPETLEINPSTN